MAQLGAPSRGLLSPVIPLLMLAFAAAALLLAAFTGCGGPRPPRQLLDTTFELGREGDRPELRLRFSGPVVDRQQVGILQSPPAVIYPPLAMSARWTDRQTLRMWPLVPLRPSTRYRIALTWRLADLVRTPSFSFINRPLQVEKLSLEGAHLLLIFNQPVSPALAARRCRLLGLANAQPRAGRRPAVGWLAPENQAAASQVTLTLARPLSPGPYRLHCEGLSGAGGDAAMEEPFSRGLEVPISFRLSELGAAATAASRPPAP